MKRKRGIISLVAAAALVGSVAIAGVANAGTISANANNSTIGSYPGVSTESLTVDNVTDALSSLTVTLNPSSILGDGDSATLNIDIKSGNAVFSSIKDADGVDANAVVCDNGSGHWILAANAVDINSTTPTRIQALLTGSANLSIKDGTKCELANSDNLTIGADNASATTVFYPAAPVVTVLKGTTEGQKVEIGYSLVASSGLTLDQSTADTAPIVATKAITFTLKTPFDAVIDPTNQHLFSKNYYDEKQDEDNVVFTLDDNSSVTPAYNTTTPDFDNLTFEINSNAASFSQVAAKYGGTDISTNCTPSNDNKTLSCTIKPTDFEPGSNDISITYTADNSTAIPATDFTATANLNVHNLDNTSIRNSIKKYDGSAGSWTMGGVGAAVPKVVAGGGWNTYVEFAFTGTLPSNMTVYIGGTSCSIPVDDTMTVSGNGLSTMTKGKRIVIDASKLLTEIENAGCDMSKFDVGGGIYQFPISINMTGASGIVGYASIHQPSGALLRESVYATNGAGSEVDGLHTNGNIQVQMYNNQLEEKR